jgi:hypothetical protein
VCIFSPPAGKEWEVFTDKHGVTFYRNAITKQCEYDRPHDAVNVKPAEMLCSAYQVRRLSISFSAPGGDLLSLMKKTHYTTTFQSRKSQMSVII